jgi:mRNA interferase MazF
LVNKWEIYFCNLDPVMGSEQQGTRPVLVISNDAVNHHLTIATVLPLSSAKANDRVYPTEILLPVEATNLPRPSIAMVQQVRTLSQDRLRDRVGCVTDLKIQNRILMAVRDYFEYE